MENQELLVNEYIDTQMQLVNWELTTYDLFKLRNEKIQKEKVELISKIEKSGKSPIVTNETFLGKLEGLLHFGDPESDFYLPYIYK